MKYFVFVFIILIVLFSVFYNDYLVSFKNSFFSIISASNKGDKLNQLITENEGLKAKILELESLRPATVKSGGLNYESAKIYSTYPFNNRSIFLINLGSNDGMEKDMPVAVTPGVLFGQITEVFSDSSLVKTIFDADFKIAVRISPFGTNALLEGGSDPKVTMIKKDAKISALDDVYSAAQGFPYGMRIGEIKDIFEDKKQGIFKTASLGMEYVLNDLGEVFVITNFKSK
ncbi:MAG: rod shape-determining protein MreC [Candidatus Pacebacteria bacterium]|nr:rod shape-determining protein MreC [Candidatus Paceibacterota bacterium]